MAKGEDYHPMHIYFAFDILINTLNIFLFILYNKKALYYHAIAFTCSAKLNTVNLYYGKSTQFNIFHIIT